MTTADEARALAVGKCAVHSEDIAALKRELADTQARVRELSRQVAALQKRSMWQGGGDPCAADTLSKEEA